MFNVMQPTLCRQKLVLSIPCPQWSMWSECWNLLHIVQLYMHALVNRHISPGNIHDRQNWVNRLVRLPQRLFTAFCIQIDFSLIGWVEIGFEIDLEKLKYFFELFINFHSLSRYHIFHLKRPSFSRLCCQTAAMFQRRCTLF